jgi:hypothetical protein
MSDDIVERLREYAEEWQIDRSVVDRAADEIIRLRALVESSVVLAQPGSLTVNCVRGTVACQEAERLRARVEVLERVREAAQRTQDCWGIVFGNAVCLPLIAEQLDALRDALKEAQP